MVPREKGSFCVALVRGHHQYKGQILVWAWVLFFRENIDCIRGHSSCEVRVARYQNTTRKGSRYRIITSYCKNWRKSAAYPSFSVLSQHTVQLALYSSLRVVISVFGVVSPVKTRRNRGAALNTAASPAIRPHQHHGRPRSSLGSTGSSVRWGQRATCL